MTPDSQPSSLSPNNERSIMDHDLDSRLFDEVLEASSDTHADSLRALRSDLAEVEARSHEASPTLEDDRAQRAASAERLRQAVRAGRFGGGLLAATGISAALLTVMAAPAFADGATEDIQRLQTAASIEVLAISAYGAALGLDYVKANPVLEKFCTVTKAQHTEHLSAFNNTVTALGGSPQTSPDPVLAKAAQAALLKVEKSPLALVDLALELEQVAAETYVKDTYSFHDDSAKKVAASIMGIEAQHAAVLRAVKALLAANLTSLIAIPTDVAKLPSAAGSVGFPSAFFPVTKAAPATQGAVK
jgi:rubrerythrin